MFRMKIKLLIDSNNIICCFCSLFQYLYFQYLFLSIPLLANTNNIGFWIYFVPLSKSVGSNTPVKRRYRTDPTNSQKFTSKSHNRNERLF